jgi:diguanylate cyclase (GGDEF)-like protein
MSDEPRTILLIDDERLQFRLTEALFKNFRGETFALEWAGSYEEGLSLLLGGGYAACLLDFELGGRTGLDLIREAAKQGCRTPIIFLTAESGERVDIAAMNAGALDYLVKGEITPRALERSLRYALKLAETLEALRLLATRDQLTGLLNRREFDRILAEESERAQRFGHPLALIMIDLDHFKAVNDSHGHTAGDEVLREVAKRLVAQVRTFDRVARFGGEEMAVILMETNRASGLEVAQRLCEIVSVVPIWVPGKVAVPVTISVGVAELPADATNQGGLLWAADKALYAAKARGRNQVVAAGK